MTEALNTIITIEATVAVAGNVYATCDRVPIKLGCDDFSPLCQSARSQRDMLGEGMGSK